MEWQPIETAPRDGTEIIGAVFNAPWADSHLNGHVVRCWFQPEFAAFISGARLMVMAPGYLIDGQAQKMHSPDISNASITGCPSPPLPHPVERKP